MLIYSYLLTFMNRNINFSGWFISELLGEVQCAGSDLDLKTWIQFVICVSALNKFLKDDNFSVFLFLWHVV